jgi:hypothetical protein
MAVYEPEAHPYIRCGLDENVEVVKSAQRNILGRSSEAGIA